VTNPVKDRSGVGLPPKAERRAAGKLAREHARKAAVRRQILKLVGTAVTVLVVVGGVAVACTVLPGGNTANPSASSPSTAPSGVALDPALKTQPVVGAGTGDLTALKVETLVTGTGPKTQSGQKLSVMYFGVSYTTGTKFDASWDRGQPFSFTLGAGNVIAGWDQGLVGVPVGSRVQLDIPTDLAYGANAAASGKPAGPLRFVVDVLSAT
jgi:peptidylprolyl isomerase